MTSSSQTMAHRADASSDIRNRIIEGDACSVLSTLPPGSVDLVVFSPPYDSLRQYGSNWSLDPLALGRGLLAVLRDGGIAAVVIGDASQNHAKSLSSFRWAVRWVDELGWRLFECCVYQRHGRPGPWWRYRFRVDHEYILLFLKGERPHTFNKSALMIPTKRAGQLARFKHRDRDGSIHASGERVVNAQKCRGTIWPYVPSCSEGNRLKLQHPATFPDQLAADLIACFSNPGDLVLDPMVGSGTTAAMAHELGRDYLGIEINPAYCTLAKRRLAMMQRQDSGMAA